MACGMGVCLVVLLSSPRASVPPSHKSDHHASFFPGIPDSRPLQEGDIVNLDVSVFKDGVHGDTSRTFYVGGRDACVENGSARLVETTERCLNESIALCKPGAKFSEIGALIEEVAGSEGYKVIRDYSGHGIGTQFHMLPYVFH